MLLVKSWICDSGNVLDFYIWEYSGFLDPVLFHIDVSGIMIFCFVFVLAEISKLELY